jgi:hypothetical protein
MSLTEQIRAQALILIQDSTDVNLSLLDTFCRSAENSLRQKLRNGITPDDCKADFIAAASLLALAALSETDDASQMAQIQTGDLTLRRGSTDSAACCLRYQAEAIMTPYLKDPFAFMGV